MWGIVLHFSKRSVNVPFLSRVQSHRVVNYNQTITMLHYATRVPQRAHTTIVYC